ncbi:MAG: SurA N-terminal domain-containing protein [Rickettsiales bacterium]|jgi:peptidyl-prolyl cis-trans isomerase D|nr:SurA N-terminal domain-containing protein [Rickettsiales bacterium]
MLQQLRNANETIWAKILMGILIFSFVGWGAASWIFGDTATDDSIISVGGDKVRIADFEAERNRQFAQMERAMKKSIYSDKVVGLYFSQQILSNLASRMLLDRRAEDIGLGVSRQAIAAMIKNAPEFQSNGFFSTDKFDAVLAANNISEDAFVEVLRRQMLREMLLSGVSEGVRAPEFMVKVLYDMRFETRKIDYAAIKFDDFAVSAKPTEEDLQRIYAMSKQMVPEFRTFAIAKIAVKNMESPDEYDAAFARAQKMEDALIGGATLAEAAAKVDAKITELKPITIQKKTATGADVAEPALNENLTNELFGLDEGADTSIIELKDGFAIVRVMKIDFSHAVPFEDMKTQLAELWVEEQKEQQAYLRANAIIKELNENPEASFRSAAAKAGARNYQVGAQIARTMTSVFPEEVLNQSFAAKTGSNILIPGRRAFYVSSVRGVSVPKSDPEKLAAIKSEADSMISRMIMDDYTGFLSRQYPIRTNTRVFNRLFNVSE